MDQTRFDAMTKTLSRLPSRRDILRGLAGAGLGFGSLRLSEVGEAKNKHKKKNGKKKGRKVTICHQGQTITVSKSALKAHLAHGDTEGSCPTTNTDQPSGPSTNPTQPSGPTCTDGVKNGAETDVDCGGGTCPRCAVGKTCASRNDCASARCAGGACQTCNDPNTDCGTDSDGGMCACRDHASGKRFCTKINGRLLPAGTPCTVCQGGEQCFPINGGAGGIECILPCGA